MKKGDIIKFGKYRQIWAHSATPIELLVLDVKENEALLISLHALNCRSYHDERVNVTWRGCDLRKWLNDDFIHLAFSRDEVKEIKVSEQECYIKDRIFCLSIDEAKQYFNSDNARLCKPTDYIKGIVYVYDNGCCDWWLRSPGGGYPCSAACVSKIDGSISSNWVNGFKVNGVFSHAYVGVRPALRIILKPRVNSTRVNSKFLQFFYSYFRLRKKK